MPDTSDLLVAPSTPSDWRAQKNQITALKHILVIVKTEATVCFAAPQSDFCPACQAAVTSHLGSLVVVA